MRFLYLIEEDNRVRMLLNNIHKEPALLVADVSGRISGKSGYEMLIAKLTHVEAVEVNPHFDCQSLCKLSLTDAVWSREAEAPDRL